MASYIARRINHRTGVSLERIDTVIRMIGDGAPIEFIARYRKNETGNLDERRLRQIALHYREAKDLEKRRREMLDAIEAQSGPDSPDFPGSMTPDLRERFEQSSVAEELEDLFLPFRSKRQSKANLARRRGLEPLADYIHEQRGPTRVAEVAMGFLSYERKVLSVADAIEGALMIVADRISQDVDYRKWLRNLMLSEGEVRARSVKTRKGRPGKYASYDDFSEKASKIPSHRMLAVRRGTREKFLSYSIEIDDLAARSELRSRVGFHAIRPSADLIQSAIDDAYERLLRPVIESEVRNILKERAEDEAVMVFEENLSALLLAPPAGRIRIMGIDPVGKGRSKLAVIAEDGTLVEHHSVRLSETSSHSGRQNVAPPEEPAPTEAAGAPAPDSPAPEKDSSLETREESSEGSGEQGPQKGGELVEILERTGAVGIVIGSGAGARPVEKFVRNVIRDRKLDVFVLVANEVPAGAYATSDRAQAEFPDLDVPTRSAISIARRLQDPLAEMVKVEPKSIGVGQYQHDVDAPKLEASIEAAVEAAVNRVGADVNSASVDLLRWISGLTPDSARAIVEYRNVHGPFKSRAELRSVPGIDDKAYTYSAGFLRIRGGIEPLDATRIHPEHYGVVARIADSAGTSAAELLGNHARLRSVRFEDFEGEVGKFLLIDIRNELYKPGSDIRKAFVVPRVDERVREIQDLQEGMELEGTVTNVTNFGAFVDIGVGQDGLVHISELSHRYVSDARRAVEIGDVVKVKVISVEKAQKRISLSVKAATPKPVPERRNRPRPHPKRPPRPSSERRSSESGADANGRPPERPSRAARSRTAVGSRQKSAGSAPRRSSPPKEQHESISHLSMEEQIRRLREKFKGPDEGPSRRN